MSKYRILNYLAAAFFSSLLLPVIGVAGPTHWGYEGQFGPLNWDKADPSYFMCKSGKNQSPIDVVPAYDVKLPPLELNSTMKGDTFTNNGHTAVVHFPAGNTLMIGDEKFNLLQLHFHAPGENHLNGKGFPMEAHFVHKDSHGNLLVLALFFVEGKANPNLGKLWQALPKKEGETNKLSTSITPDALLPSVREYAYFNGSLTTPPCSEGVRWLVLEQPVTASKEQIAAFAKVMGHFNNRPLQPVNARPILK
ncbi:MAG: carbonic anhydrase [Burkholderiaceae bacterium]|jgi:carbonic anhydrase|nr:carbonic anhydrase [Burkholderiaceae bacterium]